MHVFKHWITGIAMTLFVTQGKSQILSITPAFPSQNDTVEIIYDATQGNGALTGIVPVYAHAGLITNASTSPTDWKHVQGNWGTADANVLMTPLGNNKHKISYHIPTYYGFPSGTVVQKLAFVFRDASGNNVGRSADGSDIYYDIYSPTTGFIAKFLAPSTTQALASGDSLRCVIASSDLAHFDVYDNGVLVHQDSATKQFSFYVNPAQSGNHTLIVEADNGTTTAFDTVHYVVNPTVPIAPLPAGMELGINEINDTTVTLVLYAPGKDYVYALNSLNGYQPSTDYYMNKTPSGTHFWLTMNVPAGQPFTYQYWVDGAVKIADPFSTLVLDPWNDGYISSASWPNLPAYPNGETTGIVTLYQTAQPAYNWKTTSFAKPDQEELLIYELLIRDFVSARNYQTLIDTLDYLENLGINAIELMPNSEFEGNSSWGYNPSFHMALDKYYGTPDKFREFVDSCHSRGIAVIMDQVFNHAFGQNPIAQLWWDSANNRPASDNPYMNATCPHPPNCWGNDFNHFVQPTRDYIDRINTYWIENFHIDGIRFDFTKGFTNSSNADAYQQPRINELKRMADTLWSVDPDFYVILEHWGPNSEETVLANYGMMLWGNVTHAYYEAAMGYNANSDFSWGVHSARGWNDKHLITYMESHDEERASYKIATYGNANGSYDTKELSTRADRIILSSAFFYTIPGPKMLYMLEELGYDISIDDPCRVCEKPIIWKWNEEPRRRIYAYMAAMMEMRKTYPVFNTDNFSYAFNGAAKRINLNHPDMNVTVVGNFDVSPTNVYPNFQHTGMWYDYFTGDSIQVTNATAPILYDQGEWHIYTDVPTPAPSHVNVEELDLADTFLIYPNPSTGEVYVASAVELTAQTQWSVKDVTGKTIAQGTFERNGELIHKMDIQHLPTGMYVLTVQSGQTVHTERLILE